MNEFISRFDLAAHTQAAPTTAIKDCIDIGGMATTGGCPALADAAPATIHADVVARLLDAGWRITGKTNMHELAYGMTGINAWTGTPTNPQDAARIPGGSSSGSAAAVGAGLVDMALGSDTGGSIRLPAACCGVIGLKPTFGRVSRGGAYPAISSLDCVGPFARTMSVLIEAMAAIDPTFDAAVTNGGAARVGIVTTASDPQILAAVAAAVAASGWQVEVIDLPGMAAAGAAGMTIIGAETFAAFGHLAGAGRLGADIEARLGAAGGITPLQLEQAERTRVDFTAAVERTLLHVDALVLPTLPHFPPLLEEVKNGFPLAAISSLVRPFNLSGHPALSFPVPVADSPLKAGLQIVGRKGADARVCALALHLEQALLALATR